MSACTPTADSRVRRGSPSLQRFENTARQAPARSIRRLLSKFKSHALQRPSPGTENWQKERSPEGGRLDLSRFPKRKQRRWENVPANTTTHFLFCGNWRGEDISKSCGQTGVSLAIIARTRPPSSSAPTEEVGSGRTTKFSYYLLGANAQNL